MTDKTSSPNIQQLEALICGGETIAGKGGWSNGMVKTAQRLYGDKAMAVDRVFMPEGTQFDSHAHHVTEILVCASGQLSIETAEEIHQLRPTDVLKISAGTVHSCQAVVDTWVIGILVADGISKAKGEVL